jgi:CheY-like chemotaxis protein
LRPIRIAVVDDDQVYQFIINRTVSKLTLDSKILSFSNCADFYNFLKRNLSQPQLLPDLVLLDLNSPFMNGWEFLNEFKSLKNSIPKEMHIYMVTSSVDPADSRKADNYDELSGFFQKPILPEQLYQIAVKASVL